MFVRMLHTADGSPNGIEIRSYQRGEVYDLPEPLVRAFVDHLHWAERFSPAQELGTLRELTQERGTSAVAGYDTSMVAEVPENTMLPSAPESKLPRQPLRHMVKKKAPGRAKAKEKR